MTGTRSGPTRRLGFFGRLGSGNYGNDGSFEAVLAVARRHPSVVVDAMCSGPEVVRDRYGVPAEPMHWDRGDRGGGGRGVLGLARTALRVGTGVVVDGWRTMMWVREHDVVVVPGMGIFEHLLRVRPWQVPWSMFVASASGRFLGSEVAFLSVGADPLPVRSTRFLMVRALRLAAHRSYRDQYSRDVVAAMGVDTSRDVVLPDVAFSLPPPAPTERPRTIGVGVMDWGGGSGAEDREASQAAYERTVVSFVSRMMDDGFAVRLFAGDDADEVVALRVREQLVSGRRDRDSPRLEYVPTSTLGDVMREMAGLALVVGTRYHNVVSGLRSGCPTIAIAYGRKHCVLLDRYGLGAHCHEIDTLDEDALARSAATLLADRAAVVASIMRRAAEESRCVEQALGGFMETAIDGAPAVQTGAGRGGRR